VNRPAKHLVDYFGMLESLGLDCMPFLVAATFGAISAAPARPMSGFLILVARYVLLTGGSIIFWGLRLEPIPTLRVVFLRKNRVYRCFFVVTDDLREKSFGLILLVRGQAMVLLIARHRWTLSVC
jgi:hypothetical protein